MNQYTITDCPVGSMEKFSRVITAEMMDGFRKISGDVNPLHLDDAYAKRRGYPGRVVYGMLTASLYSTLAGVYLPGENCLLYSVDSKFTNPVWIGDELTVEGTVTEVHQAQNYLIIKAKIKNAHGDIVSRGKIMAGVWNDE